MYLVRTRSARTAVAWLAAGALVFAGATSAGAAAPAKRAPASHAATVINIDVTTDGGFTLPATVRPGVVTFRISTSDTDFHAIQGFATKGGATLDQVINDFTEGLSGDRPRQAAGAAGLLQHATLIGGVVTSPRAPIEVTVILRPNTTYHFFDLLDLFIPRTPQVHSMRTVGPIQVFGLPSFQSVAVTFEHESGGTDMYMMEAASSARHDGTFLVINVGAEVHEVVWRQARPEITNEYVATFYDAVRDGLPRPPSPWLDSQHGLQAISPGQWAIVKIDLVPGNYAVICFVPSAVSGIAHGWTGMHVMQTLT